MVANPLFDLLAPVCPEPAGGSDPTLSVETAAPAAEQSVPAELGGEPLDDGSADEGWDPPETYDDYTSNWQADYAHDVGMPLREKIR